MKKVLVVSHQAHYIYGGEVVTLAFLREFARASYGKVEFASPPGPYQERARDICPTHTISAVDFRRNILLLPRLVLAWFRVYWELRVLVRSRNIEIVHANTLKAMVYCWPLGIFAGIPVVWHHHDIMPDTFANRAWLRVLALGAQAIITPSNAARRALIAAGIAAEKISTVWNGFDPEDWTNREHFSQGERFVAGFVGEISARKGADWLPEIARALEAKAPGKILVRVIGASLSEPEFAERVRRESATFVSRGTMAFLGRREDVKEQLQQLDCLLVPSRQDPFPTVILEAAFSGVPAIACEVGGIPEMIRHGESGFFVDTPEEFAARVIELAENRETWRKLGRTARLFAETNFSIAAMCAGLIDVYNQCK